MIHGTITCYSRSLQHSFAYFPILLYIQHKLNKRGRDKGREGEGRKGGKRGGVRGKGGRRGGRRKRGREGEGEEGGREGEGEEGREKGRKRGKRGGTCILKMEGGLVNGVNREEFGAFRHT